MPRPSHHGRPGVEPLTAAALDAATAAAATSLPDIGVIVEDDPDAPPVFDPNTGTYTTAERQVYAGPMRVEADTDDARVVQTEGATPVRDYWAYVPLAVTGITDQQRLTVTTSHDPRMQGRTFTVTEVVGGTAGPLRQLKVQESL